VTVPRTMIFSIALNGLQGLGMLIAALFCLGDLDTVLLSPYPFMAIFKQAVRSAQGATAMAAIVTTLQICAVVSLVATASRMTWAFARDRGLPGWSYLSRVEPKTSIPITSVILTAIIPCLLVFIILGSSVAFNDIASLTVSCLYISYLSGNSLLLYHRLTGGLRPYNAVPEGLAYVPGSGHPSWGPWRIAEPFGTIINAFGCMFMVVILFFSFWPTAMDPTVQTMNFSSVMLVGVIVISVLYYIIWARKVYTGPIIEIE